MDKLRALAYFVAAAEGGSFAAAARQLEVSVPAVHRLVSALESRLGVTLFDRSAKGLTLTAIGSAYLDSCRPLMLELLALDQAVGRSANSLSGLLVVGAPSQLAHHLLLPVLPHFHANHPEIQIDFRIVRRPADADASDVDLFLLQGWPEAPDLVHQNLGHAHGVVAATPTYWQRHGIPRQPADLADHSCLLMRNPAGILIDLWEFKRGDEHASVKVGGWLGSNDREVVLDAVLAGEGVGRLSSLVTRSHLQSGLLVPVLLDWEVQGSPPLNLLYRASQRHNPRVREFMAFVVARLRQIDGDGATPWAAVERPQWHRRGYARASSLLRWHS